MLTGEQERAFVTAITDRKNILVGGGTGSGKTTFVNALLRAIAEHTSDRLHIAEARPPRYPLGALETGIDA